MMFPEQKDMDMVEMQRKKAILEAFSDKAFLLSGDGRGAWKTSLINSRGEDVSDPLTNGSIK
jgi:hypothetical protein